MCRLCESDAPLVHDSRAGEMICTGCGLVVESHMIDERPEWFTSETSRAAGVSKDAAFLPDSNGAYFASKKRFTTPDAHKTTRLGLRDIERCAGILRLDSDHVVVEKAKKIYVDFIDARRANSRVTKESERTAISVCALYFGCKSNEREGYRSPRTIKELAAQCGATLAECTDLLKSFKELLRDTPYHKLLFTSVKADDLFVRAVQPLELSASRDVLKKAREIFGIVQTKHLLEGRTPETVCCAVIFRASELLHIKINKKNVSESCGITVVTLNKALKDLKHHV